MYSYIDNCIIEQYVISVIFAKIGVALSCIFIFFLEIGSRFFFFQTIRSVAIDEDLLVVIVGVFV